MAKPNPTDCPQRDTARPAGQDVGAERTVLAFLLDERPNLLTVNEVSWALHNGPAKFDREDAVERAVHELVGAGLLHRQGSFVLPTRAALCFARLELG